MCTRRASVDVSIAVQMYLQSIRLWLYTDCLPCQNVSVKPGWKVNGTRLLGSFQRKISGKNEASEKVACFSGWNIPNRNSCSISSKPSLVPVSGPSRSFLGKWNGFVQMVNVIPARNLPVLNFVYHLPKPSTDWFANVNDKQPLIQPIIDIYR